MPLTYLTSSNSPFSPCSGPAHSHSDRSRGHHNRFSTKHAKDKYDVEMAIHEGKYASVKPCTRKGDGQEYFMRVIDKAKIFWNDDAVLREVKIMTKLKHEHIMRVIDHWETSDDICMVIEPTEVRRQHPHTHSHQTWPALSFTLS